MATTKKAITEAEQAAEIKEATAAPTAEPEAPAVTLDELEGMDMNMFDVEETESAPRPVWRITDDGCADWACRKIAEEKTELDRITALGESQIEKIQQRTPSAEPEAAHRSSEREPAGKHPAAGTERPDGALRRRTTTLRRSTLPPLP